MWQLIDKLTVLKLLTAYKMSEERIKHSIKVAEFSSYIASIMKEKNINVDKELVFYGGLLHDIGHIFGPFLHNLTGGYFLRRIGYEKYARFSETHGASKEICEYYNIPGEFLPLTIEEKIVAYASIRVKDTQILSLDERIKKEMEKSEENKRIMRKARGRLKRLESELSEILNLSLNAFKSDKIGPEF